MLMLGVMASVFSLRAPHSHQLSTAGRHTLLDRATMSSSFLELASGLGA